MEWEIAPRMRVDLAGFEGMNCAGERHVVNIHVVGGRQGNMPENIKSLAISGPIGTRVTLMSQGPDVPLDQQVWRCIVLKGGHCFKNKEGNPTVRIPDIDYFDAPDARRTDPDLQSSYPQVNSIEEGKEWSFGRAGRNPLKGNIRFIKIDKIEKPAPAPAPAPAV